MGVINISSPVTGCALSSNQSVTVQIFNFGISLNTNFDVSYRINGGVVVTETLIIAPGIFSSGSTYSYTFSTTADLSASGSYLIQAFTSFTSDVNPSNDSFSKTINSDAVSVGGSIIGPDSVCGNNNGGTLNLSGHTGNVLNWEFSDDLGANWLPISNTTTVLNFTNLVSTRLYRVHVKNASCMDVFSNEFSIYVDTPTVGGSVSGSDIVCITSNNGNLVLSGFTGEIKQWEYSEDSGLNWFPIVNNSPTLAYNNLTQTTIFRVLVKSGVCLFEYSSNATITVLPASSGGSTSGDFAVCGGLNNGSIQLTGYTGNITHWEYSEDQGNNWIIVANTTNSMNFNNLIMETWYRASVLSCNPSAYSSISIINTDNPSEGGVISGSNIVCADLNSGTLVLSAHIGNVLYWEESTNNGTTWTNIPNTDAFYLYSNLNQSTLYRAIVQNGTCNAEYSQIAQITVDSITNPGIVSAISSVCISENNGTIELENFVGSVIQWQSSIDNGNTWINIANTSTSHGFTNLITPTYFRAEVQNGICPSAFSPPAIISIDNISVAGNINGSAVVCSNDNSGLVELNNFSATQITWQYSIDEGASWLNSANLNAPKIIYVNLSTKTSYRAFVQNGVCAADTSGNVIIDLHTRTVNAGVDVSIQRGESVNLSATGGLSYTWYPNVNLNNNTIPNPVASPFTTTIYIVTAIDYNGCTDSDSLVFTVKEGELKIANLVTPNGDGYNDSWIIEPAGLQPDVFVFNSSGMEIFNSSKYDNSWNGSFNGSTLPDGTYYYIVKFESKVYKGALTLLGGKL